MKKIIKNMAQCRNCGDILESKSRCDAKRCSCGSIMIDGGKFYLKRKCKNPEDLIELSECTEVGE